MTKWEMMTMTGFATAESYPALRDLWAQCFGDDQKYVDFIFRRLLSPENILTAVEDGAPRAMLCLQPFTLSAPGGEADACYIFGVATHPEYRGRGLSTSLLEEAHCQITGRGMALSALVPSGEELFGFYGKRGYQTAFEMRKIVYRAEELKENPKPCKLSPVAFGAIATLRNSFYADRPFARWDVDYLRYIGGECRMLGGDVLMLSVMAHTGFAVCYPAGDAIVIKELAMPPNLLDDAVAALHAHYGAKSYLVCLPADIEASHPNQVLPFAMVRWYDKGKQELLGDPSGKSPFIAHVLD